VRVRVSEMHRHTCSVWEWEYTCQWVTQTHVQCVRVRVHVSVSYTDARAVCESESTRVSKLHSHTCSLWVRVHVSVSYTDARAVCESESTRVSELHRHTCSEWEWEYTCVASHERVNSAHKHHTCDITRRLYTQVTGVVFTSHVGCCTCSDIGTSWVHCAPSMWPFPFIVHHPCDLLTS